MTDKHDSPDFVMPEAELLRGSDDLLADFDRGVTVFNEFVTGCRSLYDIGTAVTVFGSARFDESHRYYRLARKLGRELAGAGYTVLTGGGPGIMEAANRGAKEGGGLSVGCNITLPHEQAPNRLPGPLCRVRPLLRAQGDAGQVFLGLRFHAGRIRHPG